MHSSLFFLALTGGFANAIASNSCACGFYDRSTSQLFTDSIIVYFNETQAIPEDIFRIQSFTHRSEQGWNSLYRQGAVASNSLISKNQLALDLFLDPSTGSHLVNAGAIASQRQDILHGTFRASVRGPAAWAGGSALSMMLQFNQSSSMEIDMLNSDNPSNARITTLINGEYPSQDLGLNYTILQKGSDKLPAVDPWEFITIRMDWTKEHVNFTLAENLTRSISSKREAIPTEPLPLIFKHWSTGDPTWMEGPPKNRTVASIAWVRAFFNSSVYTTKRRDEFDVQCSLALTCDVDDLSLRGSSNYTSVSLHAWTEESYHEQWQKPSGIVAGCSSFFGVAALLNVLFRRKPWEKMMAQKTQSSRTPAKRPVCAGDVETVEIECSRSSSTLSNLDISNLKWYPSCAVAEASSSSVTSPSGAITPASPIATSDRIDVSSMALPRKMMGDDSPSQSDSSDRFPNADLRHDLSMSCDGWSSTSTTLGRPTPQLCSETPTKRPDSHARGRERTSFESEEQQAKTAVLAPEVSSQSASALAGSRRLPPHLPPPAKRIDYLAGLVTISCVSVTLIHFTLTFVPWVGGLGSGRHYKSETYSRWAVTPVFLNPIWIGPFFTTSTRFLAQNFLRTGDLVDVAKKMLLRAPRMVIPAVIVAAFEYFFIELGLTAKLEFLPSITWSTWPWVANYPNFGWFLNEILELGYLIPNKAPGIVDHYCVGVLWTIPVQLQFSYTTLLGAVMVREIKSRWKRFAFYAWCITVNWYSLSWGSCFWLGLLIADLNVTYNYVAHLQARPKLFYPVCLGLWILMIQGPLWSFLEDRGFYNLMTYERSIHPEPTTGIPQGQVRSMYPAYFEPRLNTILFAGAVQMITELSTSFQAFLSLKVWIILFPHTFTIYLAHGFIFWSFGSWLCVTLFDLDFLPYWSICLILFLCCYTMIGIVVICLTPLTEGVATALCRNCWRWASQEPVPHRKTLEPFRKDLFLSREGGSSTKDEESIPVGLFESLNDNLENRIRNGQKTESFVQVTSISSNTSSSRSKTTKEETSCMIRSTERE